MPIEIRELIIKAVVDQQAQSAPSDEKPEKGQQKQVIRESVEQVMDILERKEER